jgi:trans-aconitate methyltransferase
MTTSREWDSESYHRLSDPQFGWGQKVLARLTLNGSETVLDAGCGTGRLTFELLQKLPRGRVVALDLSENMLRGARQTVSERFGNQVRFICSDFLALPLQQAVDGIFSTAAFHWVTDHPKMFRELFAALKPGGWLVAQCGGSPNLRDLQQRAARLIATVRYGEFFRGWRNPWHYADPEITRQRLLDAGFERVRTWTEHAPITLNDAETYREYLRTVTCHRHIERITAPELRDRFLNELALMSEKDDHPPYVMDYWRLNIEAHKPRGL